MQLLDDLPLKEVFREMIAVLQLYPVRNTLGILRPKCGLRMTEGERLPKLNK